MRPQLHSGFSPAGSGDALVRNQDVTQFSAESHSALHDIAIDDDAAAQAGSDHDRDRGFAAVRPEDREVSPERARIAVVQIGHGFAESSLPELRGYRIRPSPDAQNS